MQARRDGSITFRRSLCGERPLSSLMKKSSSAALQNCVSQRPLVFLAPITAKLYCGECSLYNSIIENFDLACGLTQRENTEPILLEQE